MFFLTKDGLPKIEKCKDEQLLAWPPPRAPRDRSSDTAMRRRVRKTQKHRPAGGGSHAMFRRLAQNFGAIGVGQNEPRILWHDFDGHGLGDREKEPIAMGAIVAPFCVCAKIRDGRAAIMVLAGVIATRR
jgi:hypothetical protein